MPATENALQLIFQDQTLMVNLGLALATGIALIVIVHIVIKKMQIGEAKFAASNYLVRENIIFKLAIAALTIFVMFYLIAQKGYL